MINLLRKLPAPVEFFLVLLIGFWWAIYGSIMSLAYIASPADRAQANYVGIGIVLDAKGRQAVIMQVIPATPAAKAGLTSGLIVQKVDSQATEGKSFENWLAMIRGSAGSKVQLELVDPTHHTTNTVALTRELIQGSMRKSLVSDTRTITVSFIELAGLAAMFGIARVRVWPLAAWGFQRSWKLTGAGLLLWLVTAMAISSIYAFSNSITPGSVHGYLASRLSPLMVVLFALINPAFEELFEAGYFVQALQRHGMWLTVLASAAFRAFLHAYQGINALLLIFPIGLIFGFVYWKWRRLWPLYVAHVIFDFIALCPGLHKD
ncbi:MAG TPA: CPBP family glutamic-type intramembrane protease [Candidatus Acidoferrales bacterium]|jgi:membrane protease YdiL (CAAX protease family)|nr:CPBP family glutamic-type intramembrane protease [Candidatus Acidoferrales bacterium]